MLKFSIIPIQSIANSNSIYWGQSIEKKFRNEWIISFNCSNFKIPLPQIRGRCRSPWRGPGTRHCARHRRPLRGGELSLCWCRAPPSPVSCTASSQPPSWPPPGWWPAPPAAPPSSPWRPGGLTAALSPSPAPAVDPDLHTLCQCLQCRVTLTCLQSWALRDKPGTFRLFFWERLGRYHYDALTEALLLHHHFHIPESLFYFTLFLF